MAYTATNGSLPNSQTRHPGRDGAFFVSKKNKGSLD